MQERLQWIVKVPARWVHWAPVRGGLLAHQLLGQRYQRSESYVLEETTELAQLALKNIAKPWWNARRWRLPTARVLEPGAVVQMVWANMALHMSPDPLALITQWHSLLESDGFLMFSCFGPDTLRELRRVYAKCGWPSPSHEFTDMHDWGDMLVRAGFAEPVMDMERITLTFASPQRLLQELRGLGRNLHTHRFPGLRGRAWRERLQQTLQTELTPPNGDGSLQLTFEIIYGHAFKPLSRLDVRPETTVSLDAMRNALRQGKP
jgi:malonyl-CoA O-methyltransferase